MKIKFLLLSTMLTAACFGANAEQKLVAGESAVAASDCDDLEEKSSFSDNTFFNVSGMYSFGFDQYVNYYYRGLGSSLQYGKWFTPKFAIQLNSEYAFASDQNAVHLGVDFMTKFAKAESRFSFVPFIGLSANFYNARVNPTYSFNPAALLGLQIHYALSETTGLFVEGRSAVAYTDGLRIGSLDNKITNFSAVKIGVSYKFNVAKQQARKLQSQLCGAQSEINSLQTINDNVTRENARLKNDNNRISNELNEQKSKNADLAAQANKVVAAPAPVFFAFDSSVVSEANVASLKFIADMINSNPSATYEINGYADSVTGSPFYNQKLSKRRAEAIAKVLVDTYDVNEDQLDVVGKGGVNNLFKKAQFNRCVIIEAK